MSLQVELLEKSFNDIKPYGSLFISDFLRKLFKNNPEIKSLFIDIEPDAKENLVWDSLVLIMDNLRQPANLKNIIQGLGARLFTHGLLSEHYPLAKEAFISTFSQFLGSEWTSEIKQAWENAYIHFSNLMLEGADLARKQIENKAPVIQPDKTVEKPEVSQKRENVLASLKRSLEKTSNFVPFNQNKQKKQTSNEQQKNKTTIEQSSKNLESITKSPVTQTISSKSESTSTATAIVDKADAVLKVDSVASIETEQLDNQAMTSDSESQNDNKNVLIGGGIAGAVGILLLMILL